MAERSTETEVLAQGLEHVGHKIESLEARIKDLEGVIPRLETAAETTARALEEVSPGRSFEGGPARSTFLPGAGTAKASLGPPEAKAGRKHVRSSSR